MTRPNIVYIFCDELRIDALQCYGNPYTEMKTTHIDEIAKRGVLFENCFCNSPVCVASRMSTLTSLYPEDTGVYHNEAATPPYQMGESYITIPQHLQSLGYQTASFGKTHLPCGVQPFMYQDTTGSSMSFAKKEKVKERLSPKKEFHTTLAGYVSSQDAYEPDLVVKHALDWMQKQEDPYFVRIAFTQPHTPIIVKEPYQSTYSPTLFPSTITYESFVSEFEQHFSNLFGLDSLTPQEIQTMYQYYYGMVHWIDDQIGLVLAYLKEHNQLEHTVLVLHADHGALRGENGCLAKQTFSPMSQRVPLIISYPEKLRQGLRETKVCSSIDLGKTLCALLESEPPKQFKGNNLLEEEHEPYIYATIGYGSKYSHAFPAKFYGVYEEGIGWPRRSCIRKGQYRLDMTTRINDAPVKEEEEDLFFTDNVRYPKENVNLKDDPAIQEILQELKEELYRHIKEAKEVDASILGEVNETIRQYHQ